MHIPPYNAELRPAVLREFINENPLGILTTAIRTKSFPLLQSSHIPWLIDHHSSDDSELGTLRGHIAKQNPQGQAIIQDLTNRGEQHLEDDVLILFQGPVQHYVTPKFYTATKPATGKVVPTWNYEAVQVYGSAKFFFDSKAEETEDFLKSQLQDLSMHAERSVMGHESPWEVADAPERYIGHLKKNIIGVEVKITSMAGRFKMSQEKPKGDRDGVINGFLNLGSPAGSELADKISMRAAEYDAKRVNKGE
ncbi:putative negative transcriptional regulator [Phaeomoniella chlamydospora]|uniref:Putative negative transcriptional regulator n=1 Tax=Phaeomoniella chlamydospora TaxID=158046 RepID=A0A0G2GWS8_PHACM|nr:putative negative transcriptional regulator [Phaeomoniella chlamydospora]